ncbi:MAG: ribonuclease III [Oscillospiraceae bacterium]|nr:ribonuclease III [Oscillospiraceae bacterium]
MTKLEESIGHEFKDRNLLETAVTHSSYANENKKKAIRCNERLEFLGDAVLGLTVADRLYRKYPDMPEGEMTRLRAELVCEHSLHEAAKRLDLGSHIRLGHGEEMSGGRTRGSILADAVEALIAAVYLDGGDPEIMIDRLILTPAREKGVSVVLDHKTLLQERMQRTAGHTVSYETVKEEGPDHSKTFTVRVIIDGKSAAEGEGSSKKEAEQAAARRALEAMDNDA